MPIWAPTGPSQHGLQLFPLPPACPHQGHLFTTGTSLVELGLSLTCPAWRYSTQLCTWQLHPPGKAPKATAQPQGRWGQHLGAWDRVASFSLLVELVFLHLLLSRLCAPWGRKSKELSLLSWDHEGSYTLTLLGQALSLERHGSDALHSLWTLGQVEGSPGHSMGTLGEHPHGNLPLLCSTKSQSLKGSTLGSQDLASCGPFLQPSKRKYIKDRAIAFFISL